MTDAKLKSLVERINRLMDERDGVSADIRDLYAEAKGVGYIPKALRKVVARLRADPAKLAEEDALQETYEAALGRVGKALAAVRGGATWDAAAAEHHVPRATLARAAAVSKQREVIPEENGAGGDLTPAREAPADDADSTPPPPLSPGVPDDLQIPAFLRRTA